MPQALERYVFVYGTLRRGGRNDINRLHPAPDFMAPASVPGRLYSLGWYPGLLLGGADAVPVAGEVYRVRPELEACLDEIEEIRPEADSEYFKREVPVVVKGRTLACLIYEINPERVRGLAPLPLGDWLTFYAS